MLKLTCFVFFLFFAQFTSAQEKIVKTKVAEGITVSLPQTMFAMTPSDIAQRYPSVRKPIAAYTDQNREVAFSINRSATQWRESDVDMAKGFFKAGINNLYDKVTFLREEITTIDNKQFIVFEVESRVEGEQYSLDRKEAVRGYVYIQYLIINGKTLVFSFTCSVRDKEHWQEAATTMMNSIKVKNNI